MRLSDEVKRLRVKCEESQFKYAQMWAQRDKERCKIDDILALAHPGEPPCPCRCYRSRLCKCGASRNIPPVSYGEWADKDILYQEIKAITEREEQ